MTDPTPATPTVRFDRAGFQMSVATADGDTTDLSRLADLAEAAIHIEEAPRDATPGPDRELNRAPGIITKAMRMAAAEALGFDPAIVKRIVIDAEARSIEVTTFVVKTDAAYVALNAPAHGELLLTRRYPFDAETR